MGWVAVAAAKCGAADVAIEVFAGRRAIVYACSVRRARVCASVGIRTVDVRSDGDRITERVVEKSRTRRADGASAGRVAEKPVRRAESRNGAQAEKSTGNWLICND
jgi:hypothetical protein